MFQDIMQRTFMDNRIMDYAVFLLVFLLGIAAVRVFKAIVIRSLKKWAERTVTALDDFLIKTLEKKLVPVLYLGAFYLSVQSLTLHPTVSKSIDILGVVLLTVFSIRFLMAVFEYVIKDYWLKGDEIKEKSFRGILPAVKVAVWGLGVVFLLDNLGFKISTVVAGLGIGGIAVAIASQAVLGDLFSYFAILFDRPFDVDDFIIVGDYLGTVEHVGIKTTRIRSLSGEQLVFSNTDLTNSRVRNYKRMQRRRVVFSLGVTYQTGLSRLKEIPAVIKNVIESIEDTAFDRAHFFSYGDFSLVFEVVYYVIGADYNKYMDIQQEINFRIKEEFEKRAVEFAYPTQTLFIDKT